jgi:hypothetical protein
LGSFTEYFSLPFDNDKIYNNGFSLAFDEYKRQRQVIEKFIKELFRKLPNFVDISWNLLSNFQSFETCKAGFEKDFQNVFKALQNLIKSC